MSFKHTHILTSLLFAFVLVTNLYADNDKLLVHLKNRTIAGIPIEEIDSLMIGDGEDTLTKLDSALNAKGIVIDSLKEILIDKDEIIKEYNSRYIHIRDSIARDAFLKDSLAKDIAYKDSLQKEQQRRDSIYRDSLDRHTIRITKPDGYPLIDWAQILKQRMYSYNSSDFYATPVPDIDEELKPYSLRLISKDDGDATTNLLVQSLASKNVDIEFWYSRNGGGENSIFPVTIEGRVYNTNVYQHGFGIVCLMMHLPSHNQSKQVMATLQRGNSWDISSSLSAKYGYTGDTADSFSSKIDNYAMLNGQVYFHVSIKLRGLALCHYVSFSQNYGRLFDSGERIDLIGLNISTPDCHEKITEDYSSSYLENNLIIDSFDGVGTIIPMNQADLSGFKKNPMYHPWMVQTDYKIEHVQKKILTNSGQEVLLDGYRFSSDEGNIIKYENSSQQGLVFSVLPDNVHAVNGTYTMQFWVDLTELRGNTLQKIFLNNPVKCDLNLAPEGMYVSNANHTNLTNWWEEDSLIHIVKREGDFVCVQSLHAEKGNNWMLYGYNDSIVKSVTIYNPVLLSTSEIDPFHSYLSYSGRFNSSYRGKKVVLIGDSQYNNMIAANEIASQLGMVVYDMHYGGHSLGYANSNTVNPISHSWFYQKDYRNLVLSIRDVDYYMLTFSTNDCGGGGSLSAESINSVKESYPYYGDEQEDINRKMRIFESMSGEERSVVFGFQQTYAAYIEQMMEVNPSAQFFICTVPISCTGMLTGSAIPDPTNINEETGQWRSGLSPEIAREQLEPKWLTQADQTREIAGLYNSRLIDLKNSVGLTYSNFTNYCNDGTHWNREIGRRIGKAMIWAIKEY